MNKSTIITAMIETPKGSNQKFDYDPEVKRFKLSKLLPAGVTFIFDLGLIKGTRVEDGDPLDITVISEGYAFPGCLVDCRVIDALQAEHNERNGDKVRNDRFIGIPEVSHLFSEIRTLEEMPETITSQLEAFFKNDNEQAGKNFKVTARLNAGEAAKILKL